MLEGKTVLITGGSTGIGRATALALAAEQAFVVIADLNDSEGEKTIELMRRKGGQGSYHHLDVSEYEQVNELVNMIAKNHGKLDGAFNNAGIEGPTAKVSNLTLQDWNDVIRVNLTGVFICIKCEIEQMEKQSSGGSIVSTASVAGLVGIAGAPAYNASKHGVIGLTKTIALEYASRNIRANAVCPGFIETPMLDRVTDASVKIREQLINNVPMRRVANPSEIGDTVAWLISDKSSYMTGVALPIDGGWVAQ